MSDTDYKEVAFWVYCPICKHYTIPDSFNPNIGTYDGEKWSGKYAGEEYLPCSECLETGSRYGTEVPIKWEAK